jgi:aminoglycoside phosphotransferase (APT) family kinase protein
MTGPELDDTQPQLGDTPWRRSPEELQAGLTAWAEAQRGSHAEISDFRVPQSGMANDTILFHLDGEPLVARLSPAPDAPYPTFPQYDLHLQRDVIELVWTKTDVPVPEVVQLEEVDHWLGVPFIVVRQIDGVVPADNPPFMLDPDGWFLQGSPADWKRFERSMIDVLARLHTIPDDDAAAFLRPGSPGDTALARQLGYQHSYYEWAREGRELPLMERTYEQLLATLPANDESVLNWGDSRVGNIIFRDFEPVGVLDWEMATVGPREVDVAWTTFFQKFNAWQGAMGGAEVPALFGTDETAAIYEEIAGVALDDLRWYEAFAGYRLGIILLRMSLRMFAHGMGPEPEDPNWLIMFVPLMEQLLADVP